MSTATTILYFVWIGMTHLLGACWKVACMLTKLRTSLLHSRVSSVRSLYCIQRTHTIKEDELAIYIPSSHVFGVRTWGQRPYDWDFNWSLLHPLHALWSSGFRDRGLWWAARSWWPTNEVLSRLRWIRYHWRIRSLACISRGQGGMVVYRMISYQVL